MQGHKHAASRTIAARAGQDSPIDYASSSSSSSDCTLYQLSELMTTVVDDGINGTPRIGMENAPRHTSFKPRIHV